MFYLLLVEKFDKLSLSTPDFLMYWEYFHEVQGDVFFCGLNLVDLLFKSLAFEELATLRLATLVFKVKIECTSDL